MSNAENDKYIESLQERFADIMEYITPGDVENFQRLVSQDDLEGAKAFVETLEAVHADDLR